MFRPSFSRGLWSSIRTPPTIPLYRSTLARQTFLQPKPQNPGYRFYRQQRPARPQYQRFQGGSGNIWQRWAARPTFYREVGGLTTVAGGFYVFNLETVPVSGRRRFNCISSEWEKSQGEAGYQQILQEYSGRILPEWHPATQQVRRVLERLIPQSGLEGEEWEVHVIQSDEVNAFVIPGGKVFVFSGILPICGDDDGVAAVLGHEIAHNVAHHTAERMSQALPLFLINIILSYSIGVPEGISRLVTDLVVARPGGRKQEAEADYIGLLMMAQSCYNPEAAVRLWQRMAQAQKGEPPQFLSTHPSNHNRQEKIQEWLPQAREKQDLSDCHATSSYASDFKRALSSVGW
ncbi:hypothetical protein BU16DRAFT_559721 [Lophium mytilinum]|uniref:Peptidase M48 domain-containing protein n=1 Tax=Lophium mytilinum TaxID=390894 RepID=A0A6A6R192_9PEZI|nr:hypothetical protein BU16DRAFT_559721 [Lophium mytilinum]